MPEQNNTRPVFRDEVAAFPRLRRLWGKIYHSKLYQRLRHSHLNPYRWGVKKIEADNFEAAREKARAGLNMRFIYKDELYSAELDCPVYQELEEFKNTKIEKPLLRGYDKKPDIRDNIPRNEKGELDLFAEEPIIFAIVPVTGPALIGHVGMEYDGHVMNRLLPSIHTDPLPEKYGDDVKYFFVYPSKLGLKPKDIVEAIDKHNKKKLDKKYNLVTNNCAGNTGEVLKSLGIKDIDFIGLDKLGLVFTNPGNNPFNTGIQAWCRKHGVHVTLEDVKKMRAGKQYPDNKKYREELRAVERRYNSIYR